MLHVHLCYELYYLGSFAESDVKMSVALEELEDFQGVWKELGKIWSQIDELKEQQWLTIVPRKVTKALYD